MRPNWRALLPLAVIAVAAAITFLLVSGREAPQRQARPTPPPVVRVAVVSFGDTQLDVESQGQVTPRTQTEIVARVAGEVIEISPSFVAGGFFEADEVLLRIDPTDYRLALRNAEAGVARAETRLAREEKESEIARRDWADLGTGEPDPLVLREPQLAEARAQLAAAGAALERARLDLARTRIRVPYDGRVRDKLADVGRYVTPGTHLASVYAIDAAEVRLAVPADQIGFLDVPLGRGAGNLKDGPRVSLRSDFGGQWNEWIGRIVRSEGIIDPATRMLHVVARVEDPYGLGEGDQATPLAVGLFTEAVIEGRIAEGVVVLPRSALRGKSHVLVVDAEDRIHPRDVEVLRVDREVAVITGGLSEGELVCLSPIDVAVDGMKVRVQRHGAEQTVVAGTPDTADEETGE